MKPTAKVNDSGIARYRRLAAVLTHVEVLHPQERTAALTGIPVWRRAARRELEAELAQQEARAVEEGMGLVARYEETVSTLERALTRLDVLGRVRLEGKVDDERSRLNRARAALATVRSTLESRDFAAAGKAMQEADRELWAFGGPLTIALNGELQTAAYSRELRQTLAENQARRKAARQRVEEVREQRGWPEALAASVEVYDLMASALELTAQAIGEASGDPAPRSTRVSADNTLRIVPPQELPRLEDVGGLDDVKETLRRTLGVQLERPDEAARYGVTSNGVLLYGPPGTGKTLLARAVAGQYGLRFLRVSPAVIASPYAHETAKNLKRVFEQARDAVPCLLFLDEVDALGSARTGLPSAEHRELVTQLLTVLEEYRAVRGLVIMAATNALELLDTALREGRFDVKIAVPLPDVDARRQIVDVHLRARGDTVAWDEVDLTTIARRTAGRSGAALESLVTTAAEYALRAGTRIRQEELLAAVSERVGRDRVTLEDPVRWSDVVLPASLEKRLRELLRIVQRPELAEAVGIQVPAGILLYGPPGTGKTTIAKALATEAQASFYEVSAAEILSKWVGESEEKVAKLFARARENRPSIIFIDEIESLLRRRSSTSVSPWEERVVAQFLRELDGMRSETGVFLVGATNRIDIIDDAIVERRLISLEVPLPDLEARCKLLRTVFSKVQLAPGVDLDQIARVIDGMSGADIKRMRDEAGLKALSRTVNDDVPLEEIVVSATDLYECLQERRQPVIPE